MSWTLTVASVVSGAALVSYTLLLAFTVRNGLGRRTHRNFAAYLASMMLWSFGAVMMYADPADVVIWQKVLVAGTALVPLTFYGFVRRFRGQRGLDMMFIAGGAVMILILVLNAYGYLFHDVTISAEGLIGFQFGPMLPVFGAYYLFFMALSAFYLVGYFRRTQDFETRNRIKYVLLGTFFILIGSLTNLVPLGAAFPLDIMANLINALLITYAISRYHLLDLTVILRKGLMYPMSTGLLVAGYLVVVFLGVGLLHLVGGARLLLAVAVAVVVAVLLQPGREWVQGWVDRVFFREKYDAALMLERLSRQVTRLLDLERLSRLILDEVRNAMQTSSAALLIRDKDSGEYVTLAHLEKKGDKRQVGALVDLRLRPDNPVAVWLNQHNEILTARDLDLQPQFKGLWAQERAILEATKIAIFIGLTVGGELVGILVLGPKLSETTYTPDELRTLRTLANQVAVAVKNAWLYQAALEEKERAQTILQAAAAGIVVTDRELRIVTMNPSAETITGRRLAELYGRPLTELLGPDLWGEGQQAAAAVDAALSLPPSEVRLNGEGQPCDLLVKVTALRDGFLVNLVDITRLKEVDRLKSEIVANVSHELRSPLASIKGYTELLLEEMDSGDRAVRQRFLSVINEEADRLADFINDMLDLTRLESGHVELMLAPTAVDSLVAEVAQSLEPQARAAGVTIEVVVPVGLPLVMVDRKLMHSVVKNLVSNAIKFSPRGAAVQVNGRAENGTVALEVIDHGPGISAEDLPNLFKKFYRGRAAWEAGISGTGLGLVLVKQTVQQHHGVVAVETAPGAGSRFIVTLPVGGIGTP